MIARTAALSFLLLSLAACQGKPDVDNPVSPGLRIVSLAPNLTELVYTVGAGDQLVAVSAWSDFPPAARELPVVGDAFAIDQEQLRLANPDLVLVWESGTPQHTVDALREAGYEVTAVRTRGLADIAAALHELGKISGNEQQAADEIADFERRLDSLREQYRGAGPIRVFYQVSRRPLYTVNGAHYVSELIELCGGVNIFADLGELAPTVDVEAVVDRNPEALLASTDAGDEAFDAWSRWPDMKANQYNNHFLLPGDEIGRPTTRVLIAADAMCIALDEARARRSGAGSQ